MFWKSPKSGVIISADLHRKIAQSCAPIIDEFVEVSKARVSSRDASARLRRNMERGGPNADSGDPAPVKAAAGY